MKRLLLVDADSIFHAACHAHQVESWWDDNNRTVSCNVGAALESVQDTVADLQNAASADMAWVCLQLERNPSFRVKLWPEYKIHRRKADVPVGLFQLKLRGVKDGGFTCFETPPGYETDDMLGRMMTDPIYEGRLERVLWSIDKDMNQIPGLHLHPGDATTPPELIEITVEEADRWHLYQTLVGDAADGYPGCPKIGPVNAERILGVENGHWPYVVKAFEKAGLTEADALIQARVARILRYDEQPGMWVPNAVS